MSGQARECDSGQCCRCRKADLHVGLSSAPAGCVFCWKYCINVQYCARSGDQRMRAPSMPMSTVDLFPLFRGVGMRALLNGDPSLCRLFPVRSDMPEQLWLPGLEAPPTPTDGLFFAVFPDTGTAAGIAKLAQQLCRETRSRSRPLAAGRSQPAACTLRCTISGILPAVCRRRVLMRRCARPRRSG